MKIFKFFSGNKNNPTEDEIIRAIEFPRRINTSINELQPVKNAVVNAINICNRNDINYENYEHYFGYNDKLKVLDIRHYRNPVYTYFVIRYRMGTFNSNLDDEGISQLRLEVEEYYRLIHETP